jgi:hypothetical protein
MSAADSQAAVDRLVTIHNDLGHDFGTYALLALSILGWNSPEVLAFILDRTDAKLAETEVAR